MVSLSLADGLQALGLVGTAASLLLSRFAGIEFATIGSKFPELGSGMSLPKPSMPDFDLNTIKDLVSPALTIAFLCAIESLLAAMVADGVTGKQHDSNTELIAQGMANIVTPLFGGIPSTGALARTMASINNGARTSVAGLVHSVVLLLIYLFLMPYVIYVPLGCLAAILIVVAYNMSEWRSFKYLLKGEKSDIAVLLLTFFLTVVVDLTVAIEVGILLAIVLFVRRTMQTSSIRVIDEASIAASEDDEIAASDDIERLDIHKGIEIYEINDQGTGNSAAGSDHGADAQVDVTGQNTQQHTDGQDDHVAVLHDQVVDVHGGQVLAPGQNREENVNDNQHDHHAVLSHVQACRLQSLPVTVFQFTIRT